MSDCSVHAEVGPQKTGFWPLVTLLVLGLCMLWGLWSILLEMQHRWAVDPTYSHGHLVPLAALVVLAARRNRCPGFSTALQGTGLFWILTGVAAQLGGMLVYFRWLAGTSLLFYVSGIVVLVGGWVLWRWAAPAIGILVFMIPLPFRIDTALQQPLKRVASLLSCYALQTLGVTAFWERNIIVMSDAHQNVVELGVVDACSGLKMFLVFFCLSTVVAILATDRGTIRALLILSAPPIAIVCNVVRITTTGLLYAWVGERWGNLVFHDLAGWVMMPLALVLLWSVFRFVSSVLIDSAPSSSGGGANAAAVGVEELSPGVPESSSREALSRSLGAIENGGH